MRISTVNTIDDLAVQRAAPRTIAVARPRASPGVASRRFALVSCGCLALATLAAHGWSLRDGLFIDDHLHQQRLASIGWSPSELLSVTTIAPDDFVHCWWQERSTRWQYARPLSVLLMKAVYVMSGGRPVAQHTVSLLLHLCVVFFVFRVCWLLTWNRFWSFFGALLFAWYTHTIIPVGWTASQNALLQTGLTLAAVLLYLRASDLDIGSDSTSHPPTPLNRPAFAGVVACFVLSLLSRENGVVLPVFLIAMDLAYGGRRTVWARRYAHLGLATIAAVYVAWRLFYYYEPLPDFYQQRGTGPAYVVWCLAKLLHYVCSTVWLTPMTVGPTGRYAPFSEVPGDCALMIGILTVMSLGYYLACRNIRGWWLWPLWILLSVAPVVTVMATPHTGYMAGVGFAVAMMLGPALRRTARPVSIGRWSPAVAAWFMFATLVYVVVTRLIWDGMQAAENYAIAGITAHAPPDERTTDLFFINLPFVNVYSPVHLSEKWGDAAARPHYHVLTYAPDVLRMDRPCRVERLDEYRLRVRVEGKPYYSGALGRYLIEAMRPSGPLKEGDVVRGEGFDATVEAADEQGVWSMIFTFRRPLNDPRYRFYVCTDTDPASLLQFDGPSARLELLPAVANDPTRLESEFQRLRDTLEWVYRIRSAIARVVRTDLYMTGPPFPGPRAAG